MNGQINRISVGQRLLEGLFEAEKMRMSAEQYIKVIMPLSDEKKLLVRALERIYSGVVLIINRVLQYEYVNGRVKLSKDKEDNLRVFFKVVRKYGLNEEDLAKVREILFIGRKHRESGMEFSRRNGFVVLDDDLKHYHLNENKIKEFIIVEKRLINCVKRAFRGSFSV